MIMSISNNRTSSTSIYSLNKHLNGVQKSLEKLSSGLRINKAEDDPSGYAVRNVYRSEMAVMQNGIRNAEMGISAIQTAEAAISDTHNLLVRMKELATQASTGTYTGAQRLIINSEFSQMAQEIDRIAKSTSISGINLIDGSLSGSNLTRMAGDWIQHSNELDYDEHQGLKLHFGPQNRTDDYLFMKVGDMTSEGLFKNVGSSDELIANKLNISTQDNAQKAILYVESAIKIKETDRTNLGHLQNRLEMTIQNMEAQYDNIRSAESKISDVDFAEEVANFTSLQMLSNASTSMLAQANALPQMALQLLS